MSASFPTRLRVLAGTWSLTRDEDGALAHPEDRSADDTRLMRRVQAGDHNALAQLFDRYYRLVFEIGRRVLRDVGEAEELAQEVFFTVFRKAASFEASKGSLRGWLRRIAYREAFNRRDYLNNRRFYDCDDLALTIEEIKSAFDLEREADANELEALLRGAMESLNEKQRTVLELSLFEGYTLREISEKQRESLVNTRHHYYRALERIRRAVPFRALRAKKDL